MKRILAHTLFLLFFIVSSCQKEPMIRFGFDADFGKDPNGLTIINVDTSTQTISLKGDIVITEGEIMIELINPDGEVVFESHLKSHESMNVDESFQAVTGNWKLKYASIEGVGSVTLHLSSH